MGQDGSDCAMAICGLALLLGVEMLQGKVGSIRVQLAAQPKPLRWAAYYATTCAILFCGAFNSSQQFIYFQF